MKVYLFFLIVLFFYAETNATVWTVDDDGTAQFTTIQDAINAASDGDTIFVRNGTYGVFHVPALEITINGESNDSTMIVGNQGGLISSTKRCELNNLRFTGHLLSALYVEAYADYDQINVIPELVIHNCVFDADRTAIDGQKTSGILIEIAFDQFLEDAPSTLDTLAKKIRIFNNTFINKYRSIALEQGGIVGKTQTDNNIQTDNIMELHMLRFDCSDNYYGVFDSTAIDAMINDYRDPLPYGYSPTDVNRTIFDFSPWSDTLITRQFNIPEGLRFNNFINCEYAFYSFLIYDSTVNTVQEQDIPSKIKIISAYPNPFNSKIKIRINSDKNESTEINIYNIAGQELRDLRIVTELVTGENYININFNKHPSGVYFIRIPKILDHNSCKVLLLK